MDWKVSNSFAYIGHHGRKITYLGSGGKVQYTVMHLESTDLQRMEPNDPWNVFRNIFLSGS